MAANAMAQRTLLRGGHTLFSLRFSSLAPAVYLKAATEGLQPLGNVWEEARQAMPQKRSSSRLLRIPNHVTPNLKGMCAHSWPGWGRGMQLFYKGMQLFYKRCPLCARTVASDAVYADRFARTTVLKCGAKPVCSFGPTNAPAKGPVFLLAPSARYR
jgi:hypothetical protein